MGHGYEDIRGLIHKKGERRENGGEFILLPALGAIVCPWSRVEENEHKQMQTKSSVLAGMKGVGLYNQTCTFYCEKMGGNEALGFEGRSMLMNLLQSEDASLHRHYVLQVPIISHLLMCLSLPLCFPLSSTSFNSCPMPQLVIAYK